MADSSRKYLRIKPVYDVDGDKIDLLKFKKRKINHVQKIHLHAHNNLKKKIDKISKLFRMAEESMGRFIEVPEAVIITNNSNGLKPYKKTSLGNSMTQNQKNRSKTVF